MSTAALSRVAAESVAEGRSFLRHRTAVFFTFLFPLIIVGLFGVVIGSGATGDVLGEPQGYYVPGYLAVVVALTPLSRVGSTVARNRESNRFEKIGTTPLSRVEWLLAQTVVNVVFIGAASAVLLGLLVLLLGASVTVGPALVAFLVLGIALFCGLGAIIGRLAGSTDGVVAASNAVGIPLVFLSDTFVPPDVLPLGALVNLSPLTYFARGVRAVTYAGATDWGDLAALAVLALVGFLVAAYALPWVQSD